MARVGSKNVAGEPSTKTTPSNTGLYCFEIQVTSGCVARELRRFVRRQASVARRHRLALVGSRLRACRAPSAVHSPTRVEPGRAGPPGPGVAEHRGASRSIASRRGVVGESAAVGSRRNENRPRAHRVGEGCGQSAAKARGKGGKGLQGPARARRGRGASGARCGRVFKGGAGSYQARRLCNELRVTKASVAGLAAKGERRGKPVLSRVAVRPAGPASINCSRVAGAGGVLPAAARVRCGRNNTVPQS